MDTTKDCHKCGVRFTKPSGVRGKRWRDRKYCSIVCQRTATKQLGQKKNVSEAGRKAQAENGRRNINKETPEQRQARMKNIIEARSANGIWKHARQGKYGELDPTWLGDKATYNTKHRWIHRHWKKTGTCEFCSRETKPFGKRKYGTEWANLDGAYNRDDRETWAELCVPCHRKLDNNRRTNV